MKALLMKSRGGPEQLVYEDVPTPEPAAGKVRIRVHAASITPTELRWDETYRHPDGSPRIPSIPAHDVSGVVDALGPGTERSDLKVGDSVYGLIDFPYHGGAAEYAVAPAETLAPKPNSLNHLQAAAVPLSALSAWQALYEHGQVSSTSHILIHGASGGVGAYAVQFARWTGARITASASMSTAPFLEDLGVDSVIDYQSTAFEKVVQDVDVVIDLVGGETRQRSWQVLRSGGRLITLTGPIEQPIPRNDVKGHFFIVRPDRAALIRIAKLIEEAKVRPFVQEKFALADGRKAFERAYAGHLRGKLVLEVISPSAY